MKRLILVLLLCMYTVSAYGDKISSPPPMPETEATVQHYLQSIYDNLHVLEVTTTNPDGSRKATKGTMLILITGGNTYLEVNTDSGTTWEGIVLSNTP